MKADGAVAKAGAVPEVNGIVKTGAVPKVVDAVVKAGSVPKADGAAVKTGGLVTAPEGASGIKFSFFWLAGHLRLRAKKRY